MDRETEGMDVQQVLTSCFLSPPVSMLHSPIRASSGDSASAKRRMLRGLMTLKTLRLASPSSRRLGRQMMPWRRSCLPRHQHCTESCLRLP